MDVQACDESGNVTGVVDGDQAHATGVRHLVVSAMLQCESRGWLLVRTAGDTFSAGHWTCPLHVHPAQDESPRDALARGAREQYGVTLCEIEATGHYTHSAVIADGITEHEYVLAFTCSTTDEPDPGTASELRYVERLTAALRSLDDGGTPWGPLTANAAWLHQQPRQDPEPEDLTVSGYSIFVGDTSGGALVSHGLYGTFDMLDRATYDVLKSRRSGLHAPRYGAWTDESTGAELSLESLDPGVVRRLNRRGYLVPSQAAERAKFTSYAAQLHQDQKKNLVFVIMPTYDCNLRCGYCFQDHLRQDPANAGFLRGMTPEVARRIVAAMADIKRRVGWEEGRHQQSIGLFGGEPLLPESRAAVEVFVDDVCRRQGQGMWAVSNGTHLEAYEDLLGPGLIETLQITLDGPREMHDSRRFDRDGQGSFDDIEKGIQLALDHGCAIDVRINVDVRNIDDVSILMTTFDENGWLAYDGFSVEAAPVHRGGPEATQDVMFGFLQLTRELRRLTDEAHPDVALVTTSDSSLRDSIQQSMETGTIPARSGSFCSAYNGMYVFDALSDVYACWEKTANPAQRIGRVTADGAYRANLTIEPLWRSRSIAVHPVCSVCPYGLWCGGGCASQAEIKTGDMGSHLCEGYAGRFKQAARDAYERQSSGVAVRSRVAQKGCG